MSWIEEVCRWSIAYGYVDWAYVCMPRWHREAWEGPLDVYARALGLDPEEGC